MIVPLYIFPGAQWGVLEQDAKSHPGVPVVAIINPDSGPGTAFIPAYASGIHGLVSSGITPIGYVWTNYGAVPPSQAEAQIEQYHRWYPYLRGIFLDGMAAAPGVEQYYSTLTAFAKGLGLELVVGNPGTAPAQSYVGTVDIINIFEDGVLPDPATVTGGLQAPSRSEFSLLSYNLPELDPTFVTQAEAQVGWMYLTNDTLPNPWDTLPPYLGQLMGLFAASA